MSQDPVHFIPIATTVVAIAFASVLIGRYRSKGGTHLLWWAIGAVVYAVGTLTESTTTIAGWSPAVFRAWYISGALLGGAPLAQGTVYLLCERRTANRLAVALVSVVVIAAACVLLTPLHTELAEAHRLSGRVIAWSWVRWFSPFINLYAVSFLVGGAIVSAVRYYRRQDTRHRALGNVFIAVGALLPGIGGAATRFGHVEVLYVTELAGLLLIWAGYHLNTRPAGVSSPQAVAVSA